MRIRFWLFAVAATAAQASAQTAAPFNLERAPSTMGSWGYRPLPGASESSFVDTRGITRLTLRCDIAARRVTIAATSPTSATAMTVWATETMRSMPARFDAPTFRVIAEVAARDPLLDAIAFSRGRIAVSVGGSAPLAMPSAPEPARVVEDCRI